MNDKVSRKLAAARTRLILDKPFLGALVLRLPLKPVHASWCPTTATDARVIYYNPDFIEPLNVSQVQFVLAHDALHCGLSHFARREHRDPHRWNIACDHAVNALLKEDQLQAPEGALFNDKFTGLTAEEIFPLIPGDTDEQTMDQHLYDVADNENMRQQPDQDRERKNDDKNQHEQQQQQNLTQDSDEQSERGETNNSANEPVPEDNTNTEASTNSRHGSTTEPQTETETNLTPPPPLSLPEKEQLNIQWQQRLAGAAQQALQSGKMSGSVARLINQLLRSSIPWRTLLARYMSGSARVDYNLMRPSQRREGDAIMPSLHARQINVLIALDTSGSIEQDELDVFVAEVNAIKGLVNARVTLLACDNQLDEDGPWIFESWEQLVFPKSLQGHGGTDFRPVFEWVEHHHLQPDLVIYFTDAQGRFPVKSPIAETLWLVKGPAKVPWGQRIQLN